MSTAEIPPPEPPVDTTASGAEDQAQVPQIPDGTVTVPSFKIPHGPAQWAALATFVASVLAALAVGATTMADALPAGMSNAIGASITAVAAGLTAISLGIYAAVRYLNGKLHLGASK